MSKDHGSSQTSYRRDIDGLRAIAVLSVVLFHAFPKIFSGGFIGVDVFFVISGYLISGILFRENESSKFSFISFYVRRVRRIFPALIAVTVACLAFGWFALFPSEYAQLGKHSAAGLGSIANLIFWKEAGYFDNAAITKPLLHFWSLGIEEQFYFFWPPVVFLFWRRKNRLAVFILLLLISFQSSISNTFSSNEEAFFAPYSRMWELLVGGLLAYFQFKPIHVGSIQTVLKSQKNLIACIGITMLVASIFVIKEGPTFPGWWALLPVFGTAALIYSGEGTWVNRIILGNPIFVFIGLISYSLYLWHWPLLSFGHIMGYRAAEDRLFLVACSFILAFASYQFIEKPFRKGVIERWQIRGLLGAATLTGIFGLIVNYGDGFPWRKFESQNIQGPRFVFLVEECPDEFKEKRKIDLCRMPSAPADVAVFGDSTAARHYFALADMDRTRNYIFLGQTGGGGALKNINVDADLLQPTIKTIIFTFFHEESDLEPKAKILPWLKSGRQVIVLIGGPGLPMPPQDCDPRPFGNRKNYDSCIKSRATVIQEQAMIRKGYADLEKEYPNQFFVVDTLNDTCDSEKCFYAENGVYLYDDRIHLNRTGAEKVAKKILNLLR